MPLVWHVSQLARYTADEIEYTTIGIVCCTAQLSNPNTPIHQVSLLSHARIDVHDNDDDNENA